MSVIKNGWLKGIVNGVSTKLYAWSHAKTCIYGDPENGVTVQDKIEEINNNLGNKTNKIDTSRDVIALVSMTGADGEVFAPEDGWIILTDYHSSSTGLGANIYLDDRVLVASSATINITNTTMFPVSKGNKISWTYLARGYVVFIYSK